MATNTMNELTEILSKIDQSGGKVFVQDNRVQIKVPSGILTPIDRSILAQHRDELVIRFTIVDSVDVDKTSQDSGKTEVLSQRTPENDQYAADERSAIEWVDQAPPADVAAALTEALTGFDQIVDQEDLWTPPPGFEFVEPIPCLACDGGSSFHLWEDLRGHWHCVDHDPPSVAQRLRQHAKRIRRRTRSRTKPLPEFPAGVSPSPPSGEKRNDRADRQHQIEIEILAGPARHDPEVDRGREEAGSSHATADR